MAATPPPPPPSSAAPTPTPPPPLTAQEAKEKGNTAFSTGQFETAITFFTQAIKLDPQNAILFSNRSASYLSLGRPYDALLDGQKCVKLDPSFIKGYSRVGGALNKLGRYQEAMVVYGQGLEKEPGNELLTKAMKEVQKAAAKAAAAEAEPVNLKSLTPKMAQFMERNRLPARLFLPRLFLLFNALLYLFMPFSSWSRGGYRRVLYTCLLEYLYVLYHNHGLPNLNKKLEYVAQLMQDPSAPSLFISMLLLSFKGKTYFLGIASLLLQEGIQILFFFSEFLSLAQPAAAKSLSGRWVHLAIAYTHNPRYGLITEGRERWQALFSATASYSVMLEIGMGLYLILELLTPTRNVFGLFLYWQFLQMRYMLDRTGVVKDKFKKLDEKILDVVSHPKCPPVVGKGYQMVRGYMIRAVQMPTPEEQQQAQQQQQQAGGGGGLAGMMGNVASQCTIM